MSKKWDGSQVFCMTHSSLWADLGVIMMDGIADLSSGSAGLEFVNSTSNPVIIKPGQIVATAIQVDSVEVLPHSEPDDDKSIPSPEPVFSCVNFCILASSQTKQWKQKKTISILIWILLSLP